MTDGNRELITVIDCICANGTVLPPYIIMKGMCPSYSWVKDSELDKRSYIAASPNGWTDNELGLSWIKDLFDPLTQEKYIHCSLLNSTLTDLQGRSQ